MKSDRFYIHLMKALAFRRIFYYIRELWYSPKTPRLVFFGIRDDYANKGHQVFNPSSENQTVGQMIDSLPQIRLAISGANADKSFEQLLSILQSTPQEVLRCANLVIFSIIDVMEKALSIAKE